MPSEFEEAAEVGLEILNEEASENSHHSAPKWIALAAISTLVMALFSAVGALMAGITANEALLGRTAEIVEVVDRDRDQLEVEILASKHELLRALGKPVDSDEARLIEENRTIRDSTEEMAEDEDEIAAAMYDHERLAIGVTLLSIAITLSGLAVVARNPRIWHVGLVVGTIGAGFVSYALSLVVMG